MFEALVTGVCAIVAAALSATVTKYGWSFWWPAVVIRCGGHARELRAITPDGCETEVHYNTQYAIRNTRRQNSCSARGRHHHCLSNDN